MEKKLVYHREKQAFGEGDRVQIGEDTYHVYSEDVSDLTSTLFKPIENYINLTESMGIEYDEFILLALVDQAKEKLKKWGQDMETHLGPCYRIKSGGRPGDDDPDNVTVIGFAMDI